MEFLHRCKKSSKSSSRPKSSKFYPAGTQFGTTTAINHGYICAEHGANSLPYDYPYTEVNGAQALSITTFQQKGPMNLITNRNSTNTCGYIEIPTQINGSPKKHPANFVLPSLPSNISEQASIVSPPGSQNGTRALLSPPANGAGVKTNINANSDNGYVTLH